MITFTLQDLLAFAEKHPERPFELLNASNCLAASLLKTEHGFKNTVSSGSETDYVLFKECRVPTPFIEFVEDDLSFSPIIATVPLRFAHFLYQKRDIYRFTLTGQELVTALSAMIAEEELEMVQQLAQQGAGGVPIILPIPELESTDLFD